MRKVVVAHGGDSILRQGLGIGRIAAIVAGCLALWTSVLSAQAAKIGDLTQTRWTEQAWRFVTLADPVVRYACLGTVLLGITCGLLGGFLVVRRMALLGDALSHAVLPGVALGFLWNLEKDPLAIFIGALLAGLAGSASVTVLTRTTRLKEDTALGLVLASFFGLDSASCRCSSVCRPATRAASRPSFSARPPRSVREISR